MNASAMVWPLLGLSERSAVALLASIWHAGLLLAVVALALRLLPRLTAATRSLIWTAALLVIAALPLLPAESARSLGPVLGHEGILRVNPAWSVAIAAVWIAFSLYRAAQLALSGVRLSEIRDHAVPVADSPVFMAELPFGMRRTATLCTSEEIARPSVIGFFAPRILIPADLYRKLAETEIQQIVLHELEHLRRGDDWRNLLQKIAVMLFPLNPALLWIERRLCFERELACDESVLRQTQAPRSYAACLVHLAEESRLGRQFSLALGALERRSELGRRVHGILSNSTQAFASAGVRKLSGTLLTAGMVTLAVTLGHAPQFISFGGPAAPDARVAAAEAAPVAANAFHQVSMRSPFAAKLPLQPHMVETTMRMASTPHAAKSVRVVTEAVRKAQPWSMTASAGRSEVAARAVLTSLRMPPNDRGFHDSSMQGEGDADRPATDSAASASVPAARVTLTIFEFRDGEVRSARFVVATQDVSTKDVTVQKLSSEATLRMGRLLILQL